MTDYTDPATIDVDVVMENIAWDHRMRGHMWDDRLSWPNVTVKALADEVARLRVENAQLRKLAYLTLPFPRWWLRRADRSRA